MTRPKKGAKPVPVYRFANDESAREVQRNAKARKNGKTPIDSVGGEVVLSPLPTAPVKDAVAR
jgi:hypothetical protein